MALFFFAANNGTHGSELWSSDGTASGMVKDINPSGSGNPSSLTLFSDKLFFGADDGTNGVELWSSDGTASGTVLVKDINPSGSSLHCGSVPCAVLTVFSDKLFFRADDGTHGQELWSSDGTASGTVLVKDINPASGSGNPSGLTVFNGKLFFEADDGTNGVELWSSDGTASGTALLKDINTMPQCRLDSDTCSPGSSNPANHFVAFDTKLFFSANDGTHGQELWSTDGTSSGTVLLKDINPDEHQPGPRDYAVFNNKLFFGADDGTHGRELWSTDGTASGTALFKNINPSKFSSGYSYPAVLNGKLYFNGNDGNTDQMWASDGTASGTAVVSSNAFYDSTVFNNQLFFTVEGDSELWSSDGTASGTALLKDINPSGWSNPGGFKVVNNKLFFSAVANSELSTYEIWSTDGTASGTVKDIISCGAGGGNRDGPACVGFVPAQPPPLPPPSLPPLASPSPASPPPAPPYAPPPASYAVKMVVTISGTVSDFTPVVLTPMRQKVADEAFVPLDAVEAIATAGSVTIAFTVNMQSAAAADTALTAITAKLADKTTASTFLSTPANPVTVEAIVAPTKLVLVSQPPPPAAPPPASPPKKDDDGVSVALIGGIVGGLGGACLLGAVVGGIVYLKKKKKVVHARE